MTNDPIVIAHRGASGYRPEHTLESYALAIRQGADYIEPDLVLTKDGHFVARHDIYLSHTTDISAHPEFADRKQTLGGREDWYVFDFTLAELKTLRAVQPRAGRSTEYDRQFTIPTLAEIVSLVEEAVVGGQSVGLYIELKRPGLFGKLQPDLIKDMAQQLESIVAKDIPLFFQCFNAEFLLAVGGMTETPLILLEEGSFNTEKGMWTPNIKVEDFTGKIAGFGLNKALLFGADGKANGLLGRIHAMGAVTHIWTIRDDSIAKGFARVEDELTLVYKMGVDGVFTDFPDTALSVRDKSRE